jgi:HEAT repeats
VALVLARPQTPVPVFIDALSAPEKTARRNAAWAVGILGAPAAAALLPLLEDKDPDVLKETLLALSRCPGDVPAEKLLPFFENDKPLLRGLAAFALARHQPTVAASAVPDLLARAEHESIVIHEEHAARKNSDVYTPQDVEAFGANFVEMMKLIQALEMLPPADALRGLAPQALQPVNDALSMNALVAGYQLWDRIAADPALAVQALGSTDGAVADRAEWILVKANPSVLPILRQSVRSATPAVRERLIRVLAWQGDSESISILRELQHSNPENSTLIDWSIQKIQSLSLNP